MALRSKLRSLTSFHRPRLLSTSILNPDSETQLSSKQKTRAALHLLKFEKNPERVLEICRAASLTPEVHIDCRAYSEAISRFKESDHYQGITALLNEALARPHAWNHRVVSNVIGLYGHAGLLNHALNLFDNMPHLGLERTTRVLNALLFACHLAKDYTEMKRIFADFPRKYRLVPDLDTYNTVLKGFCESGSVNSSIWILSEMERNGVKPNKSTFSIVISGFYRERKPSVVAKILGSMNKFGVKIDTYNVRIQSLCKLNRADEAMALFNAMLSEGKKPNSTAYTILIRGFCFEGKYDVAKNLYKEMLVRKLQPGPSCYFILVYFLCMGKDFESALSICKQCTEKGWVPCVTSIKRLVDGLVSIEKVDKAREIIGIVKEKFTRNPDRWTEIEEGLPK